MSFGLLSRWLKAMKASSPRSNVAKKYGLDYSVLISFIEHLTYLRNLCAHHSRVWNRKMTKTMQLPRSKPTDLLSSFNHDISSLRRIYNSLVMIIYLLNIISPENHFKNRLIESSEKHNIDMSAMGFPKDWEKKPIWIKH